MLKRTISAIVTTAFIFTQCGLGYALRSEGAEGSAVGKLAAEITAPAAGNQEIQKLATQFMGFRKSDVPLEFSNEEGKWVLAGAVWFKEDEEIAVVYVLDGASIWDTLVRYKDRTREDLIEREHHVYVEGRYVEIETEAQAREYAEARLKARRQQGQARAVQARLDRTKLVREIRDRGKRASMVLHMAAWLGFDDIPLTRENPNGGKAFWLHDVLWDTEDDLPVLVWRTAKPHGRWGEITKQTLGREFDGFHTVSESVETYYYNSYGRCVSIKSVPEAMEYAGRNKGQLVGRLKSVYHDILSKQANVPGLSGNERIIIHRDVNTNEGYASFETEKRPQQPGLSWRHPYKPEPILRAMQKADLENIIIPRDILETGSCLEDLAQAIIELRLNSVRKGIAERNYKDRDAYTGFNYVELRTLEPYYSMRHSYHVFRGSTVTGGIVEFRKTVPSAAAPAAGSWIDTALQQAPQRYRGDLASLNQAIKYIHLAQRADKTAESITVTGETGFVFTPRTVFETGFALLLSALNLDGAPVRMFAQNEQQRQELLALNIPAEQIVMLAPGATITDALLRQYAKDMGVERIKLCKLEGEDIDCEESDSLDGVVQIDPQAINILEILKNIGIRVQTDYQFNIEAAYRAAKSLAVSL